MVNTFSGVGKTHSSSFSGNCHQLHWVRVLAAMLILQGTLCSCLLLTGPEANTCSKVASGPLPWEIENWDWEAAQFFWAGASTSGNSEVAREAEKVAKLRKTKEWSTRFREKQRDELERKNILPVSIRIPAPCFLARIWFYFFLSVYVSPGSPVLLVSKELW